MKNTGRLIRRARELFGDKNNRRITQAEFAEMIGISRSYLGDIETDRTEPSFTILSRISELTGLPLDFFRGEQGGAGIPILGTIRAGEPIEAVEHILGYVNLPLRGDPEDYFGLSVVGDSMNLSGIKEGDVAIIRKQSTVESGQVAAVIINGQTATIKRFYQSDGLITLMPHSSNPENRPIMVDTLIDEIRILGLVVKAVIQV